MILNIREISISDVEEIANLSLQLGYTPLISETEIRVKGILESKDNCGFAATVSGKLVGWIHGFYSIRLESDSFIEIGGMVVDKDFRRKGIGMKLIDKVKEWGAQRSVSKIRVRCNTKRIETHKFYMTIGFKEIKEQKIFDKMIN